MPKKIIDVAAGTITFQFEDGTAANGDQPAVPGSTQVFDISKLKATPEGLATLERLAIHGASQKIGDSYAGAKESGTDPVAYAKEAVKDTIEQLYANKWSVTRTGSGAPRTTLLVIAVSAVSGQSIEEVQTSIESLSDEEKAALQKQPKIRAKLAALQAEKAVERAAKLAKDAADAEAKEAAAPAA
jgi:hypothetical protein